LRRIRRLNGGDCRSGGSAASEDRICGRIFSAKRGWGIFPTWRRVSALLIGSCRAGADVGAPTNYLGSNPRRHEIGLAGGATISTPGPKTVPANGWEPFWEPRWRCSSLPPTPSLPITYPSRGATVPPAGRPSSFPCAPLLPPPPEVSLGKALVAQRRRPPLGLAFGLRWRHLPLPFLPVMRRMTAARDRRTAVV
jgi:hypothetical protein